MQKITFNVPNFRYGLCAYLVFLLLVVGCGGTQGNRQAGDRTTLIIEGTEFAFRWCPPGKFMMGSPENEANRFDDETQHQVTLSRGFWMLEMEVTQQMWGSVMGDNPSHFKGANLPVENVSWNDCQEFIQKLNAKNIERVASQW